MSLAGGRALVVEDDRSWQQILTEILTDVGLAVDIVDSLEAAISILRFQPHRLAVVDLALGDGGYDNQDGLHVLDAIRRQDPGCVAIMLTGFATVELAVSALTEYGAFTCLRKEAFDRAEFRDLVNQALARSLPLDVVDEAGELPLGGVAAHGTDAGGQKTFPPGNVLVVEDDAGWRGILSELLTDIGYEVRLCSSYGEALGCLRRDEFSLAVVDLSLESSSITGFAWDNGSPGRNLEGYQLLSSTHAQGVPTIVVSGVASQEDIESAYAEHGIFAYLQKQTFDRSTFRQTVHEARAARTASSELNGLTSREREVLALLAQGMTNKKIAEALVITTNTVKRHLKAIFIKLDVHTRSAAAAKAISAGIKPVDQEEAFGAV
jgi:DNA-binding NarL/FixJ family response regulator